MANSNLDLPPSMSGFTGGFTSGAAPGAQDTKRLGKQKLPTPPLAFSKLVQKIGGGAFRRHEV